ncbi:MAG: hypothetical protein WC527_00995 [Candidatus Margulisiibacteriota bacterium]
MPLATLVSLAGAAFAYHALPKSTPETSRTMMILQAGLRPTFGEFEQDSAGLLRYEINKIHPAEVRESYIRMLPESTRRVLGI